MNNTDGVRRFCTRTVIYDFPEITHSSLTTNPNMPGSNPGGAYIFRLVISLYMRNKTHCYYYNKINNERYYVQI